MEKINFCLHFRWINVSIRDILSPLIGAYPMFESGLLDLIMQRFNSQVMGAFGSRGV